MPGTWKVPLKRDENSLCAGLTEREEGVFGVHEHQHSSEQVFVHDVGLDVIGVVLHAEGEQLQDQRQQLSRLEVVWRYKQNVVGTAKSEAAVGFSVDKTVHEFLYTTKIHIHFHRAINPSLPPRSPW